MATGIAAPASLYVGDLHHEVTDGQLFDAFSEFNGLASVRVCRDSFTGRSLCYGYVNFISHQDAIHAIEAKNHSILNGKVIRVMWSCRDPNARRSGIGNVFVKNLNESIDNTKLQDMFQTFGNILSCKVMFENGKSKGYGFVQFESEESAIGAIDKLNGTIIEGKQIYVAKFVKRSERASTSGDARFTNLYIKNLDVEVNDKLLKEKFSEFGKIGSLVIVKDVNGTSRGFGFVDFENPDDAQRAVETMNGSQLGSKVLYVARAQKKSEREQMLRRQFEEKRREQILKYQGLNVYVKNIDDEVNDEELRDHFSQYGAITSAKLMRDEKGISKGFGFVCFSTSEEANNAVRSFHGHIFHGKPLYVAIAQRKEVRQAQLQYRFALRMAELAGGPSAVIPGGYPPNYYYSAPPRPGLIYQPFGLRPGWTENGFAPHPRPAFQPWVPNNPRQNRQNRRRGNGHMHSQHGGHAVSYVPHVQQHPQYSSSSNDWAGQARYVPNLRVSTEMNPRASSNSAGPEESETLSTKLAAASPEHQKQMLGERLFPLVSQHKPDLAGKITGMLLEMDNAELILLLESPESLAAKVENAVQALELSNFTVSGQDGQDSSYFSAEVPVN